MDKMRNQTDGEAVRNGRKLWAGMLDSRSFPSDEDCRALVAHLQFPAIRDRLIADIPGQDEPMQHILFAKTDRAPKWSRIEWHNNSSTTPTAASDPQHATPVLTTIGYINWWEGRPPPPHNTAHEESPRPGQVEGFPRSSVARLWLAKRILDRGLLQPYVYCNRSQQPISLVVNATDLKGEIHDKKAMGLGTRHSSRS